ncbi:MAG: DUF4350 domain-containing protein [Defluviitaleaceae bacterium]|nr:DUF4350 domain-containing protein [Defluviitaleaceae bacterium]
MRKAWVVPLLIVVFVIAVSYFVDSGDGVPFSAGSTGEGGVSLLYDTMRHMGCSARMSRRPLNLRTDTDHIYVIVQPRTPHVSTDMAHEMLEWVRMGGRLIYLCNSYPSTVIDRVMGVQGSEIGGFLFYSYGYGKVITGGATQLTNYSLMQNSLYGQLLQNFVAQWNAERTGRIFFAEYYHGFHTSENFVGRLPIVIQLVMAQIVIVAIIAILHLGKRFGNPVEFYEETEREENEYVRALARLYMEVKDYGQESR